MRVYSSKGPYHGLLQQEAKSVMRSIFGVFMNLQSLVIMTTQPTSRNMWRKIHQTAQGLSVATKLNFIDHFYTYLCPQKKMWLFHLGINHASFCLSPMEGLADSLLPLQRRIICCSLLDWQHLKFSTEALVNLKMDGNIARCHFDKPSDAQHVDKRKVREKTKPAKIPRKAKLNEL